MSKMLAEKVWGPGLYPKHPHKKARQYVYYPSTEKKCTRPDRFLKPAGQLV